MCDIFIVQTGYSYMKDGFMMANATCSIVRSPKNILIMDTLTPWDADIITKKLSELQISPSQITYVISSHGHPDHNGNNNLFLNATHIVGFCMNFRDKFTLHPFEQDIEYKIDDWIKIIPTPGHSNEDISIVAKTKRIDAVEFGEEEEEKLVVLAGDLFEREEDIIESPSLWIGNSFNPKQQAQNRLKVLQIADVIIPGHGKMFSVQPKKFIEAAENICKNFETETEAT